MRLSEITARTVHQMSFSETNAMTTHTEDRDRLRPFFELDHVDPAKIPISEIKRLQDLGIDNDSLSLALTHQARQRLQGVKINTLDQILGLSPPDAANNRSLKNRLHETCADQILHSVDLKMRRNETYLKRRKRGEPHITGVPVWAYSIEENGEEQAAFTERLSSEERRLILKIGNETWMRGRELAGERRKGRILNRTETLIAAFTDAPQRVLGYLATFQMKAQGQCYPSHEWIAKKTGKSRRGVQMALKVLQGWASSTGSTVLKTTTTQQSLPVSKHRTSIAAGFRNGFVTCSTSNNNPSPMTKKRATRRTTKRLCKCFCQQLRPNASRCFPAIR